MVNIILISHGVFCEGLLSSLKMIAGDEFGVRADIMSGTPYQSAAYLSKTHKIGLVSGMNMPMLLSLALELTEEVTLEEAVKKAASQESWGINGTTFEKGEKKRRAKLSINKN